MISSTCRASPGDLLPSEPDGPSKKKRGRQSKEGLGAKPQSGRQAGQAKQKKSRAKKEIASNR